jgi:hypothetical protein
MGRANARPMTGSATPIVIHTVLMGIAALHPSYGCAADAFMKSRFCHQPTISWSSLRPVPLSSQCRKQEIQVVQSVGSTNVHNDCA